MTVIKTNEKCKTCFHRENSNHCRVWAVSIDGDTVCTKICKNYLSVEDGTDPGRIKASLAVCSGKAFTDETRRCFSRCPYFGECNEDQDSKFPECMAKLMGDALRIMNVKIEPVTPDSGLIQIENGDNE